MKTKQLPSWPDSFFNRAVQKVLRQRHTPPLKKGSSRREALAFPIEAFHEIEELASDQQTHSQKHVHVLWCYGRDPLFCSRLLLAVTEFHQISNRRTDGEILAEEVESLRSNFTAAWLRVMRPERVKGLTPQERLAVCRTKPVEWKEIAAYLEGRIVPLRGHAPTARTLMRSTYPHEVRRRWAILKYWQPHIKAWAKA